MPVTLTKCGGGVQPGALHQRAAGQGINSLTEGLDLVVEGDTVRVTDEVKLRRIAAAYESKYGREWHFDVRNRAFVHWAGGGEHAALVFEVDPAKALGFRKGEPYSQTRWRFVGV